MADLCTVQHLGEFEMCKNAKPKIFWQPNIAIVLRNLQHQNVSSSALLLIINTFGLNDMQEIIALPVRRTLFVGGHKMLKLRTEFGFHQQGQFRMFVILVKPQDFDINENFGNLRLDRSGARNRARTVHDLLAACNFHCSWGKEEISRPIKNELSPRSFAAVCQSIPWGACSNAPVPGGTCTSAPYSEALPFGHPF